MPQVVEFCGSESINPFIFLSSKCIANQPEKPESGWLLSQKTSLFSKDITNKLTGWELSKWVRFDSCVLLTIRLSCKNAKSHLPIPWIIISVETTPYYYFLLPQFFMSELINWCKILRSISIIICLFEYQSTYKL